MDVFCGFEYDKMFFKIGDKIDVIFNDDHNYTGKLEGIQIEDNEITVDGCVFPLSEIKLVVLVD